MMAPKSAEICKFSSELTFFILTCCSYYYLTYIDND